MITKIIVSVLAVSSMMFLNIQNPHSSKAESKFKPDTLTQFGFSANRAKECAAVSCRENFVAKAQKLRSRLIVYKSGTHWISTDNNEALTTILKVYPLKKIAVCTGNIKVNGKRISQRNLVILRDSD
ncbi:hypothetical protein [Pedobacter foliorum]|uniref:hypothetical protein n=1 Tax=Pedobacter foliorum TaxID=2739058 RepID=UPI0015648937|nr:hypothetical protein [Pedobacter foliorum]NRF40841.1 hypothetical protein [Pedobacter foliorum]